MKITNDVVIVGIGASAGGLEALQSFVSNLPQNSKMSYIIAQHLSPTYKSMMVDLLQKDSKVLIKEAKNRQIVAPNVAYICPPNKNITIEDNIIYLSEPDGAVYSPKPSVNLLFESIARFKKEKAIGIILSGTGSDGSRGIRAIKAEGGYTIAQAPENAKYDGMPVSAINTGNIDLILPAEDMGKELLEIVQYPLKIDKISEVTDQKKYQNVYKNILEKLVKTTKVDFSLYKNSTIERRIQRRMTTLKITSLIDYNNYLLKRPEEVNELFKDILIGVTEFFRDKEPFKLLYDELKKYVEKKDDNIIRIWTPGCSTGEEPYSIAMILSEILGSNIFEYKIQIFATDIDTRAIATARKGLYPESAVLDIPRKYKNKYFIIKDDQFEVIKPIKEMVIFSKHDITRDPPFLRLDLISCRNLLIYFTTELQKRVFIIFHYSLNSGGLLLLGKSESVGQFQNHFKVVDKKWKLYEAVYLGRKEVPVINRIHIPDYKEPKQKQETIKIPSISDILIKKIQEYILPSSVVINEMMDIVYVKGENKYILRPDGEPTDNIFKNIKSELTIELRTLINDVKSSKKMLKSKFQKVTFDNKIEKFLRLIIIPVINELHTPPLFIIFFQEEDLEYIQAIDVHYVGNKSEKVKQLETELVKTKEQLQTVIEEIETSNEELQSMNEELQSSNEELQSSNEELETTNEELQSTNEELQTAYAELRASYDEREKQSKELAILQKKLEKINRLLDESEHLANMASWEWDIINDTMNWTRNFFNILGLDESKFNPTYESFMGLIYFEDKEKVEKALNEAIKNNHKFNIIFKFKTRNKEIKVKASANVIFDKNQKPLKMIGNIRKI